MKQYRSVTAFLLVLVLAAPMLVSACGSSVKETIDDGTITARVKTALLNDPDVRATTIDVDTFNGVVTLSGRVKSKAEEDKAIAVTRTIKGVTDVKSTLQIQQQ